MQEALDKAKLTETNLSAVAVTIGPGLGLCLRGKLHSSTLFISSFAWCCKIFILLMPYGWVYAMEFPGHRFEESSRCNFSFWQ